MSEAWKVLTHDYRPPVQGGPAIWDGETLPFKLKKAKLDTSNVNWGAGWNYTDELATALRIAGLWPDGRPACCLAVEPSKDAVSRGDKRRCSQLTILRRCTNEEILDAIRALPFDFGDHQERMADSQASWYQALGRPGRDTAAVEDGLRVALKTRGLEWELRRFDDQPAARAAQAAWAAWDAWAARAAWAAWDARDAWAARAALTVEFASLQGWTKSTDPLLLTAGLRDAYGSGLAIAVPVEKDVLGWAMEPPL